MFTEQLTHTVSHNPHNSGRYIFQRVKTEIYRLSKLSKVPQPLKNSMETNQAPATTPCYQRGKAEPSEIQPENLVCAEEGGEQTKKEAHTWVKRVALSLRELAIICCVVSKCVRS